MLKKKEVVYREILTQALQHNQFSFTQLHLSKKFNISLSTVNNALKPLERIGIIEKRTRSFTLIDTRKLLLFWASERKLNKDIIYTTRSELSLKKIESLMPSKTSFTAYTAYRLQFNDAPADYGEVYVYSNQKTLEEIKERFPPKKGHANIIVLEKDQFLSNNPTMPLPQIYVDLWNIKEWYAKDYLDALEKRLFP